ncbi:hypothetical protein PG997_007867 [Apiospora hydei]|uniref:Uncharacterized protein n=1 Tax=Apiospora hydei TaxID=1337664 RepID=A0ABR1W979_9PEZI
MVPQQRLVSNRPTPSIPVLLNMQNLQRRLEGASGPRNLPVCLPFDRALRVLQIDTGKAWVRFIHATPWGRVSTATCRRRPEATVDTQR